MKTRPRPRRRISCHRSCGAVLLDLFVEIFVPGYPDRRGWEEKEFFI
jgi:hypothetical protein